METQILSRNYQPPPSIGDRLLAKIRAIYIKFMPVLAKFRSGKFITIVVLLSSFLLILGAIGVLSQTSKQKPTGEPEIAAKVQLPTPTPMSSDVAQKVEQYSKKIDDFSPFDKKFPKPIVDLDINLEKR